MKNIKGTPNGKRQTITLSLTRAQVKAIQDSGDLFGGFYRHRRYGTPSIGESLSKQIIKKAGKLFPEILEEERQLKVAWEIKQAYRDSLTDIRLRRKDEIHEASECYEQAHKAMRTLDNQMEEELDGVIDAKFDEAGITMFRSHGQGLVLAEEAKVLAESK